MEAISTSSKERKNSETLLMETKRPRNPLELLLEPLPTINTCLSLVLEISEEALPQLVRA
jgi:hypothetical protein